MDHHIKLSSLQSVEENLEKENGGQLFNCLDPHLLHSNQPIRLFCPPPALQIKQEIVNLLIQHRFS